MLRQSGDGFDPTILSALYNIRMDESEEQANLEKKTVRMEEIEINMILGEDLLSQGARGILLARKGQEVTPPLLARLKNFLLRTDPTLEIQVLIPKE